MVNISKITNPFRFYWNCGPLLGIDKSINRYTLKFLTIVHMLTEHLQEVYRIIEHALWTHLIIIRRIWNFALIKKRLNKLYKIATVIHIYNTSKLYNEIIVGSEIS